MNLTLNQEISATATPWVHSTTVNNNQKPAISRQNHASLKQTPFDFECLSDCQTTGSLDSTCDSVEATDKTYGPNTPFSPPSTHWSKR